MTFKPFGLLVLALTVLLAPLSAAEPGSSGPRFRTFGWQVSPVGLCYDLAGKDVPVEIFDSARSRFYALPAPAPLAFYRVSTAADGKITRTPVASVDLSSAGPWPLLVFLPDKAPGAAPGAVRIVPLADDLAAFPAPQFRFVNFTPVPLGLTLGRERVAVQPGQLHAMDPALGADGAPETRYFVVSIATEEGPKLLYANNWVVRPSQRTLVLIFAEDNALQVRRVVDNVLQYAPPAPAP